MPGAFGAAVGGVPLNRQATETGIGINVAKQTAKETGEGAAARVGVVLCDGWQGSIAYEPGGIVNMGENAKRYRAATAIE